jgi:hypothetical protein
VALLSYSSPLHITAYYGERSQGYFAKMKIEENMKKLENLNTIIARSIKEQREKLSVLFSKFQKRITS